MAYKEYVYYKLFFYFLKDQVQREPNIKHRYQHFFQFNTINFRAVNKN